MPTSCLKSRSMWDVLSETIATSSPVRRWGWTCREAITPRTRRSRIVLSSVVLACAAEKSFFSKVSLLLAECKLAPNRLHNRFSNFRDGLHGKSGWRATTWPRLFRLWRLSTNKGVRAVLAPFQGADVGDGMVTRGSAALNPWLISLHCTPSSCGQIVRDVSRQKLAS